MKEKSTSKSKKHMSKRAKLWLANILCFVACVGAVFFEMATMGVMRPLTYICIQCAFTFFSLIVYFLSIIADALSGRTAREKLSDGKTDAPEGNAEPTNSEEVK